MKEIHQRWRDRAAEAEGAGGGAQGPPEPGALKDFYEHDYERGVGIANIPADDDFLYAQVLAEVRPHLRPNLRVLDLGCNNGNLSLYLARAGCEVTGIDLAQNAVDAARRSAEHYRLANARFQCLDFLTQWNEPAAFDLIFCWSVIEHIPDDQAFVNQIARALKPGGRLLLSTATPYPLHYRLHLRWYGYYAFDEKVGHLRRYTEESLAALGAGAGLTVTGISRLDGVLRDAVFLVPRFRFTQRLLTRRYVRSGFNLLDSWLARKFIFGHICLHARKELGS
jgi:SAM-dependent methyltransferase